MPKNLKLINPYIQGNGEFSDVYKAETAIKASEKFWKSLTNNVDMHVPNFLFTMKDMNGGTLHHFSVQENQADGSYSISEENLKIDEKHFNDFHNKVEEYTEKYQEGGENVNKKSNRKRYSSSYESSSEESTSSTEDTSSSEESSNNYHLRKRLFPAPISYFNYFPVYTNQKYVTTLNPRLVKLPVFTPVFNVQFRPLVAIY